MVMILTQTLIYTIYKTLCGSSVFVNRFILKALGTVLLKHLRKM